MNHQADNISGLGVQPSIENHVNRVEHAHLALRQAGKAIAPQIIPDRQPSLAKRFAQKPISPMKNCVTSPPTGILPPMPIGQSQASDAARARPEPHQPGLKPKRGRN